jgi:hypothetical protein
LRWTLLNLILSGLRLRFYLEKIFAVLLLDSTSTLMNVRKLSRHLKFLNLVVILLPLRRATNNHYLVNDDIVYRHIIKLFFVFHSFVFSLRVMLTSSFMLLLASYLATILTRLSWSLHKYFLLIRIALYANIEHGCLVRMRWKLHD